jgi:hypothetical protein
VQKLQKKTKTFEITNFFEMVESEENKGKGERVDIFINLIA